MPPTAGFITKWYLAIGSLEAAKLPFFFVLFISTLLSAVYYLRIIRRVFFGSPQVEEEGYQRVDQPPKGGGHQIQEVSYFVVIPLLLSAALSVVLGIYPNFLLELVRLVLR